MNFKLFPKVFPYILLLSLMNFSLLISDSQQAVWFKGSSPSTGINWPGFYMNNEFIHIVGNDNSLLSDVIDLKEHLINRIKIEQEWYIKVYFESAKVNGISLSKDNPEIVVQTGAILEGYLEVLVENVPRAGSVAPVIGTASWTRHQISCITGQAPIGLSTQRYSFRFIAPSTPGIYYIGVFAGWMYTCDEVASNDHPEEYDDGDDVWDMSQSDWETVIRDGHPPKSSVYAKPGRAIRIIVRQEATITTVVLPQTVTQEFTRSITVFQSSPSFSDLFPYVTLLVITLTIVMGVITLFVVKRSSLRDSIRYQAAIKELEEELRKLEDEFEVVRGDLVGRLQTLEDELKELRMKIERKRSRKIDNRGTKT
jgi:hypothetical protein